MRTLYRNLATASVSFILLLLCGCGPVVGLIVDAMPKPDIPAEYDTTGKKVAVFVSYPSSDDISPVFVRELTVCMNNELMANNAVASVIDYSEISDIKLLTNDAITAEMLGKKFQVDAVIMIEIDSLTIDYQASEKMEPGQVLCLISVIDGKDGKRVWPYDQLNKAYQIRGKLDHDSPVKLTNSRIIHDLAQETALKLTKLFYLHKATSEEG